MEFGYLLTDELQTLFLIHEFTFTFWNVKFIIGLVDHQGHCRILVILRNRKVKIKYRIFPVSVHVVCCFSQNRDLIPSPANTGATIPQSIRRAGQTSEEQSCLTKFRKINMAVNKQAASALLGNSSEFSTLDRDGQIHQIDWHFLFYPHMVYPICSDCLTKINAKNILFYLFKKKKK